MVWDLWFTTITILVLRPWSQATVHYITYAVMVGREKVAEQLTVIAVQQLNVWHKSAVPWDYFSCYGMLHVQITPLLSTFAILS